MLSLAIYINFFSHHYMMDLRWLLFAWAGWLLRRTRIHFKVWRDHRSMPMLLGLFLVSVFIWFSENIGTFTRTWFYPSQRQGWEMVSVGKLGSWFLLLIISYTLVSLVNEPRRQARACTQSRDSARASRSVPSDPYQFVGAPRRANGRAY